MIPNEILLHKIKQAIKEKKSKEKYQEINGVRHDFVDVLTVKTNLKLLKK